uniref:Uncharacterized protein n=1 Tax=Zea mays TaxID=4577 RepID=C4J5A8_MAIZE|nr:unknown [Zea mays]
MIMASAFYKFGYQSCKLSGPGACKQPTATAAASGGNGVHALATITRRNWYVYNKISAA